MTLSSAITNDLLFSLNENDLSDETRVVVFSSLSSSFSRLDLLSRSISCFWIVFRSIGDRTCLHLGNNDDDDDDDATVSSSSLDLAADLQPILSTFTASVH